MATFIQRQVHSAALYRKKISSHARSKFFYEMIGKEINDTHEEVLKKSSEK